MTDIIGWSSSLILLCTIVRQIWKQWTDRTSRGVSLWLFVGQAAASLGFTIYSVLVSNHIFVATNALMTASALFGIAIVLYHRRERT